MTTIFDLDYTLLNTRAFKEKLASIIGLSVSEYDRSYKENFKDKKINYTFDKHLEILKEDGFFDTDIKIQSVKNKFKSEMESIDDLLFEGSLELVLSEKAKGNKIVLVTFGNESWQREKVNRLSLLKNLFDEILYEEKDKSDSEYLRELAISGEKFYIINDNIAETEKMVEILDSQKRSEDEKCSISIVDGPYSSEEEANKNGFKFFNNINNLLLGTEEYSEEKNSQYKISALR